MRSQPPSPEAQPRSRWRIDWGLWLFFVVCLATIVASISVFLPWHQVGSPRPESVAAAFYIGPDYNVSAADRSRMLEPTRFSTCTGVDHLELDSHPRMPVLPLLLVFLSPLALAAVSLRTRRPATHGLLAVLGLGVMFALSWARFAGQIFRHMFLYVGPSYVGEHVYSAAVTTLALAVLVLVLRQVLLSVRGWRSGVRKSPDK